MKQWIDVTGECGIEKMDGVGGGACIRVTGEFYPILLCHDGVTSAQNYRWRFERLVDVPDFKWTVETVGAVDWKDISEIDTVRADWEHWCEQIEHARITGKFEGPLYSRDCPSCRKQLVTPGGGCSKCLLLENNLCCNGLYRKFALDRTIETADPVCDYIKAKLDELEAAAKCAEWEPKVWDWVKHKGESGWRIYRHAACTSDFPVNWKTVWVTFDWWLVKGDDECPAHTQNLSPDTGGAK